MSKLKKELKSFLGIILIIIISILALLLVSVYIQKREAPFIFIAYVFTVIILSKIEKKINKNWISRLTTLISIPYLIIYFLLIFSVPIFILFINFLIFFFVCFSIPFIYKLVDLHLYSFAFSKYTELYLYITIPLIVLIIFHKYILKIVNYMNENNYGNGTNFEKFKIIELSNYLFDYKSIKFILYSIYFIFLFVYSIYLINDQHFLVDSKNEKVILQSFLSFIALDRIVSNIKDFSIKPSILLEKLLQKLNQ